MERVAGVDPAVWGAGDAGVEGRVERVRYMKTNIKTYTIRDDCHHRKNFTNLS